MADGKITSSTVAAQGAIAELVGVDISSSQNQQVEFGYSSGISGMENARQVTNTMLDAISQFSEATLAQASKFPTIAQAIEKRDIEEAQRWEN